MWFINIISQEKNDTLDDVDNKKTNLALKFNLIFDGCDFYDVKVE